MKKIAICILLVIVWLNADPVRNLKAFDTRTGAEIINGVWQNKANSVRFTWKEPLFDVSSYKYVLGVTGKEPLQNSTETNSCIVTIPKDGQYIFRVAPASSTGKTAEESSFYINLDTTSPQTQLSVTMDNATLTFSVGDDKTGSPIKGVLFYYGPNPNGQPDRFCAVTADITPLLPREGNPDFYINAALEDSAGNVAPALTIATINGTAPALADSGSANLRILGRTSEILNEKQELLPGTHIRYTLSLSNDGTASAPLVELIDAVPIGTTLIANSAKASRAVRIEYFDTSLNAGKGAWTMAPNINEVRKLRWTYLEPIPSGGTPESIEYTVEANKI